MDVSVASSESQEFLAQQRMKGRPGTFARLPLPPTKPSTTTLESETFESGDSASSLGAEALRYLNHQVQLSQRRLVWLHSPYQKEGTQIIYLRDSKEILRLLQ